MTSSCHEEQCPGHTDSTGLWRVVHPLQPTSEGENIQYQRGKQWILYADYKDCGYVTSETYLIKHKDGTEDVRMNTKWTQKGRRFLYEKLKSVGVIPVIERT